MDTSLQQAFIQKWAQYFQGAELPIAFFYSADNDTVETVPPPKGHRCLIGVLNKVRRGESLSFAADSLGCGGAKRYLGYAKEVMPGFEYFLSCGIDGKLEGERYKKTPQIVRELMVKMPFFEAPQKNIVFKRWDRLQAADDPDVVIFFAPADVLSGLFTLAGFAETTPDSVIAPFAAGCGSIVMYPYQEIQHERPRAVLGMFDVSARPYVGRNELTLAVPMAKMTRMIHDMDESFLITPSWHKVRDRLDTAS